MQVTAAAKPRQRAPRKMLPECFIPVKNGSFAYNLEWTVLPDVPKPAPYISQNYIDQFDSARLYCHRPTNSHHDYSAQFGIGYKACGHKYGQISLAAGMADMYQGSWIAFFEIGSRFLVVTVRDALITAHGDMVFDNAEEAVREVLSEFGHGGLSFIICDAKSQKRLGKVPGARMQMTSLDNVIASFTKPKTHYLRRIFSMKEIATLLISLAAAIGILYGLVVAFWPEPPPPPPPPPKRIYNDVVPVSPPPPPEQ